MVSASPDQSQNAEKTRKLAVFLFPSEEWVQKGPNIYIAKTRLNANRKEQSKLYREIADIPAIQSIKVSC